MALLPDEWIDRVFMAMRATYGVAFDRQYECPAKQDPEQFALNLKAWWKRDLTPAIRAPHTIVYALDHLPTKVINLPEFKALCWQAPPIPRQEQIENDAKADPERVAAELARMRQVQEVSPKAWAYRLKQREAEGDRLTKAQRDMWRAALQPAGVAE